MAGKACIISFSGRAGGSCSNIAEVLRRYWKGEAEVYDISILSITPCGHCGYQCFQAGEECPYFSDPVYEMYDAVVKSEVTCYIVPNYCDYPCANFFAFNERSQCYFQNHQELLDAYLAVRKKFIVVSNTGRENFESAFRYHVQEGVDPDILSLSAKKFELVSIHGDLMDSEEARQTVLRFAGQHK